jgi:hypothetical protein
MNAAARVGGSDDVVGRGDLIRGGRGREGRGPLDLTACTHDDDCGQVERGCYCGRQPVTGVAERYRIDAARCELEAARNCALGCPVQSGFVADDGRNIDNGGSLANRCERTDAGVGRCRTYVP